MTITTKYNIGDKVSQSTYANDDDPIRTIIEIRVDEDGYYYILNDSASFFNEDELELIN